MLTRYRAAYATSGAAAFSAAGLIARLPIAIYPIGLVLIVSARAHAYGFAGVVTGCYVVGGAISGPIAGVLVDRYGQHRMLRWCAIAHLVIAAVFAALVLARTPLWTLLPPAVLMGITLLNIGALVRARWSFVWAGQDGPRATAYSVESVLDETVFVVGPLVATLLATHAPAVVTLSLAVALVLGGSGWLASQRGTEPPVNARHETHQFALRSRGMLLITGAMVFMGAVFGSAEVVMVAFCGQHGQRASAGWVVACFAGGSAVAGIVYGARHWRAPLLHRYVSCAVAFGVLPLLYLLARTPAQLAVCTFFVGLGIAPTLIGGFGLVDAIVPVASLTEGLAWIGTGLSVGYGAGAALVGGIADRHGAHV
ncbi:MAG TPA: MFS transporter, partial [Jatrophihabitans sp.]|nr:MFS transporter [Jatrophihabitans sp.]